MNKKILLSLSLGALLGGFALNLNNVSAETQTNGSLNGKGMGNMTDQRYARHGLNFKAEMLGISTEELMNKMENQTFLEILEEAGISIEDYQSERTASAKARWEERGISEEEIASRLAKLEERRQPCDGSGTNKFQGSPFGQGRGK